MGFHMQKNRQGEYISQEQGKGKTVELFLQCVADFSKKLIC